MKYCGYFRLTHKLVSGDWLKLGWIGNGRILRMALCILSTVVASKMRDTGWKSKWTKQDFSNVQHGDYS